MKGRQAVKEVVGKCVICKKLEGKCYSTPPAPLLPSFQVSEDLGFTSVGIDHTGPVFVKNIYMKAMEPCIKHTLLYLLVPVHEPFIWN